MSVVGGFLLIFVLIEYVNPLSDNAMIRHFKNNRNALVDVYSGEFVSEVAEARWRDILLVRRTSRFRGAHMFEVVRFEGFDGPATKGYAYMPEIVEGPDVYIVDRIRGTIGIFGDLMTKHQFRHIEGHWYLYWVRPGNPLGWKSPWHWFS